MFGRRFEKELSLVENALESESGEIALREYLKPFVDGEVEAYMKEHGIEDAMKTELSSVGWTHLSLALKKYSGRAELMLEGKNDVHYFSTYFVWYVRQAIVEYLHRKGA